MTRVGRLYEDTTITHRKRVVTVLECASRETDADPKYRVQDKDTGRRTFVKASTLDKFFRDVTDGGGNG